MAVALTFSGRLSDAAQARELHDFAVTWASDMQWSVHPYSEAMADASLGDHAVGDVRVEGLILVPHFASDPLPLLIGPDFVLVDSLVKAKGDGARLTDQVVVTTQFAGPSVHQELREFLDAIRERFVPDLVVDDDAALCDGGLSAAFAEGWDEVVSGLERSGLSPGEMLEVAGITVRLPNEEPEADPYARVDPSHRELVEELVSELESTYGGLGLEFPPEMSGIENLDILFLEADSEGYRETPDDPRIEVFVHGVGAAFGRALCATLGGVWEVIEDDEEGDALLVVGELGGVGARIDPFELATERLLNGPSSDLALHYGLLEEVVAAVARALGEDRG